MSAIIIAHFKAQEGKLAEMAEVFKASAWPLGLLVY